MDTIPSLPKIGYLRLSAVLNFIPVSKSHWWAGVKSGRYPKAVKLSDRITAWRVDDIRKLCIELDKQRNSSTH